MHVLPSLLTEALLQRQWKDREAHISVRTKSIKWTRAPLCSQNFKNQAYMPSRPSSLSLSDQEIGENFSGVVKFTKTRNLHSHTMSFQSAFEMSSIPKHLLSLLCARHWGYSSEQNKIPLSRSLHFNLKKNTINKQYRTEIEINQVRRIECNGKGKEEYWFKYEGQW